VSGEIDVVSEAFLARTLDQPEERGTLLSAGSAPDNNDHTVMWLGRCQMKKVVPVAGQ
jgi:hypothetical protein